MQINNSNLVANEEYKKIKEELGKVEAKRQDMVNEFQFINQQSNLAVIRAAGLPESPEKKSEADEQPIQDP